MSIRSHLYLEVSMIKQRVFVFNFLLTLILSHIPLHGCCLELLRCNKDKGSKTKTSVFFSPHLLQVFINRQR